MISDIHAGPTVGRAEVSTPLVSGGSGCWCGTSRSSSRGRTPQSILLPLLVSFVWDIGLQSCFLLYDTRTARMSLLQLGLLAATTSSGANNSRIKHAAREWGDVGRQQAKQSTIYPCVVAANNTPKVSVAEPWLPASYC